MRRFSIWLVIVSLLLAAVPAMAIKIAVIPSTQQSNVSPDGTYIEGTAMNDVAARLCSKLAARGFETFNTGYNYSSVNAACSAARSWGANCTISNHTNASAGSGWHSAHGTQTFYLVNWSGYSSPGDIDIAQRCGSKLVQKFAAFGVGYNGTAYSINQGDIVWNAPGDHCLVEALFHDNWNDLQVLKSSAGKDAYAQAVYEAICDHYGWSYTNTLAPLMPAYGPFCANPNGAGLEFFVRGNDNHVWHQWQTTVPWGPYSGWEDMGGGNIASAVTTATAGDGRIEFFARGTDGNVWHRWEQTMYGNWANWENLQKGPANTVGAVAASKASDGRIEIFIRGTDNNIWHLWQTAPNRGWGAWENLGNGGSAPASEMCCMIDADGKGGLFYTGADGNLYHGRQSSAPWGAWVPWQNLGHPSATLAGGPWSARTFDGRDEIFVRGSDGHCWHLFQTSPNGGWSSWEDFGNAYGVAMTGDPCAIQAQDGRIEFFFVGADGNLWHRWMQSIYGSWSNWENLGNGGSALTGSPANARTADGRIELVVRGADGNIWHRWQTVPNSGWSGWENLGSAGGGIAEL